MFGYGYYNIQDISGVKSRRTYSDEMKLECINLIKDGMSQADVSRKFDIPKSTIQGWMSKHNAMSIRNEYTIHVNKPRQNSSLIMFLLISFLIVVSTILLRGKL